MDPERAQICAVLNSEENTFGKASKWIQKEHTYVQY
jgi:hypothetical protein